MYLLLMQHAESKLIEEDPERGITDKGKEETLKTSSFLNDFQFTVDEIWHSNKKRSIETAQIVTSSNRLKNIISEKDFLSPMDDVKPVVKILNHSGKNLMIIGHLPFLSKLASVLLIDDETIESVKFVNSSIAVFIKENDKWKIVSLITP